MAQVRKQTSVSCKPKGWHGRPPEPRREGITPFERPLQEIRRLQLY